MKITGKYTQDDDFVTIFSDDTMYTIDKGTLDIDTYHIGDTLPSGNTLTQDLFDDRKSQCTDEGDFVLQDDDDEEDDEEEEY